MFITILDLILLMIIFVFISFGFFVGFISMVGSLVGLVVGAWAAGQFFDEVGAWLAPYFLDNTNLANVVGFFIVFTLSNRLIGLLVWAANKIFKLFTIIPFTKSINRLLGSLLGFLEATLFLGLILFVIARYNFSDWMANQLATSSITDWLIAMSNILTPLLPDALRQITPFL